MQPHEPSTTDGPTRLDDVTRGRGWWLRTAAIALGALCWMPGDWHARPGWFSGVLLVLVVVGTIAGTVLRERFPWLLWAVGLLGLVGGTTGPLAMGLLVVSNRMPLRDTVIRAAIGTGAFLALNGIPALAMALHQRIVDESSLPTFLALTVLVAVVLPTLAGGHLHARDTHIAALNAEMALARLEHARREAEAITREQRRIASEMHDSLGHRLVLIGLQAQTLRGRVSRGDSDLAAAVEEADTIQATAQAALTDLRDVVGALGRSGADQHHGLTDVTALVAESRQAGAAVTLVDELSQRPDAPELPEIIGRTVHRVVQGVVDQCAQARSGPARAGPARGLPAGGGPGERGEPTEPRHPVRARQPIRHPGPGHPGPAARGAARGGGRRGRLPRVRRAALDRGNLGGRAAY